MKGDHDQPCPRAETFRQRAENLVQALELAVHPDAERLERPRRRIDALITARWNRPADNRRQLQRGVDGSLSAGFDDAARDAPRKPFLAVCIDRVSELLLARAGDQLSGRLARTAVHAHVE